MRNRKIALITGASRGIGAAAAVRLAQDGYDIAVNYHVRGDKAAEVLEQVKELGCRGMIVQADVAEQAQVQEMFRKVQKQLGPVDLLVSNAGIAGQCQIQDLTKERWDRFLSVNLNGAFHAVQCALPYMLHEHRGCIITISSMWGLRGGVL